MPRTIHDATISVRVNKVLWYQAMHIVLVLFVHVVDNIKHFIVVIREKTALWLLNSSKIDSEFNLILSSLIGCFLLQCSLGVVVDFSSLSFYRHSLVPFWTENSTSRISWSPQTLKVLQLPVTYHYLCKKMQQKHCLPKIPPQTLLLFAFQASCKMQGIVGVEVLWGLLSNYTQHPQNLQSEICMQIKQDPKWLIECQVDLFSCNRGNSIKDMFLNTF